MPETRDPDLMSPDADAPDREDDVAVVGMAGRFPGAADLDQLWRNLEAGVESVRPFTDEELLAVGVPRELLEDPRYVKAGAPLDDIDLFAARFFDVSPREAEIIDPQQRMFLECAWQALEDAGYDSRQARERIGVYAAVGANSYVFNIYSQPAVSESAGRFNIVVGNENDYLASRVSFKLDLRGPSVNVQSACSSSLLAVHLACESLRNGESDLALAGGVFAATEQVAPYRFREGDIKSADGHCRPFDAGATGTIFSAGVGVVTLKRLEDALADGDTVRAVIRGSAVNNDGSAKVGYTAPGVPGQRAVVAEALAVSGVDPETVSYVEAHGTGTSLGDPIEVTALTQAFRAHTDRRGFCALGSIKGNIGHADSAAGIGGLIKTVLALQHRKIPASLNYERPNPQIDFDSSPFFVNDRLREWESNGAPRRAGVSSFGIGGTNVHAVLEEAPAQEPSGPARSWHLLTVSGRTATALDSAAANLRDRLESDPNPDPERDPDRNLADVAYTSLVGRRPFEHRRAFLCRDRDDAVALLAGGDAKRVRSGKVPDRVRRVAFLFSGQGSQYAGMCAQLHRDEPGFRAPLDHCAELLEPHLGLDLRTLLFPEAGAAEEAGERLSETALTQPALFAVEYALAQLWMEWGVEPEAMMGHSVGEYVAACLAGVMELSSALALVAARGRLMQELPAGSMLVVSLPAADLQGELDGDLALAATNGPKRSVVSGPAEAVSALEERLWARGVACRPLHTSHAFHSPMMEPMLEPFRRELERVELRAPRVPYVSNVTGTWIRDEEATDPDYWLRHVRGTVRFSEGIATLASEPDRVFLEVGPGTALTTLTRQHPGRAPDQPVIASTRHPKEERSDLEALLDAAGELWVSGVPLDGAGMYRHQRRRRVPLPTYPFERERYWVERGNLGLMAAGTAPARKELPDWFYLPSWQPSVPPALPASLADEPRTWLLFTDGDGLSGRIGERLAARLGELGQEVVTVRAGGGFAAAGDDAYTVAPGNREDCEAVLQELAAADRLPDAVLHLWSLDPEPGEIDDASADAIQERGFFALVTLAQALGRVAPGRPVRLVAASSGVHRVSSETALAPEKATLLGPCRVIPREYPHVSCTSVDVDVPAPGGPEESELAERLLAEACAGLPSDGKRGVDGTVAYRYGERRVAGYAPVTLEEPAPEALPLRREGVYLITGGLGGLGLAMAGHLAREHAARLVLVSRSGLPPREEWDDRLAAAGEGDRVAQGIRAVQALEEVGAEVLVAAADVADSEAVHGVVAQARERFGALHGVVHAAGVPGGGMVQLKERAAAEAVLRPKLAGTRALAAALEAGQGEPLDFFVLCSSTFAVLGGVGQVDYAGANAFLDAFAQERRLRGVPVTSVGWAAWREVGMAVETRIGSPAARPAARSEAPAAAPDRPKGPEGPGAPLLGEQVEKGPDRVVYSTRLTPDSHWVLAEHRVAGVPTVPGTTYLEMVRAAFEEAVEEGPVRISDLAFATPFSVAEGEAGECRLTLSRSDVGAGWGFLVEGRKAGSGGDDGWQAHAHGQVEPLAAGEPERRDLDEVRSRLPTVVEVDETTARGGAGIVEWGPRWGSLRSLRMSEGEVLTELELPAAFHGDLAGVALHPALVDMATAVASAAVARESFLPLSYRRVEALRPLPARFLSHARRSGPSSGQDSSETLSFDVALLTLDGEECVRIEGFTLKRVGAAAERLARPAAAAGEAGETGLYARGGMSNAEGIDALRRVLAVPRLGHVVVSPMDLEALLRRAREAAVAQGASAGASARERHARPDTGVEFAEPETETEKALASIWCDVLGLDQVGLDDDFFRLGGDSVLGIQVISRTGELGIRIRPEQLFEHATLRELAAAVSGEPAEAAGEGIPVTPFQRRVLEGATAPWIAGVATLPGSDPETLEQALGKVIERHEALRLRFPQGAETETAVFADADERSPSIQRLDLAGQDEEARTRALRETAESLGRTLDPVRGPVVAAAWAEDGPDGGSLLLVAHRAVADGPSLATICREMPGPEAARVPSRGTDFRDWARREAEESTAHAPAAPAPSDGAPAMDRRVVVELDSGETSALHKDTAETLRAEPHELVLTAIARAAQAQLGSGTLAVELEWDARSSSDGSSESAVGCFFRSSRVLLEPRDPEESSAETVRRVKAATRQWREGGVGQGGENPVDTTGPMSSWVRLVTLGNTDAVQVWAGGHAPGRRPVAAAVEVSIADGRLHFEWSAAGSGGPDLDALAQEALAALRALSAESHAGEADALSPEDFPDADLSQEALDSVLSKLDG